MIELYYTKNKNQEMFTILKSPKNGHYESLQNYIPLYSKFFNLNSTNWNHINLNNNFNIKTILSCDNDNHYHVILNNGQKVTSFFKLVPLIDPVKYISGKYKKFCLEDILTMPSFESNVIHGIHNKLHNVNNAAYVDGFFSYLTSQLLHKHNFFHGIDFYGSFLGIKNNYTFDIADDVDYLQDSDYFYEQNNKLFTIDDSFQSEMLNIDTRNYKKRLKFDTRHTNISLQSFDTEQYDKVFSKSTQAVDSYDISNSLIFNFNITKNTNTSSSSSSCSSRSSNTSCVSSIHSLLDTSLDTSIATYSSINTSDYSSISECVNVSINKYPVNIICLEKMCNTLDYYMIHNEVSVQEWKSILMQIVMMLITYQKIFDFTHNDLHTNNIMYNETNKKFVMYNINNCYYKVPTYGKLYKIIDFGRAIYKFKNNILCSDSYSKNGDAATQYNCEPYFDSSKKRINPNKSFDLCRLGCSLFDYFVEDLNEIQNITHPIAKLVIKWCTDDSGKNVLYKHNGKERYPGFKLYKMIARTVHNHTPQAQLEEEVFNCFKTPRKHLHKKAKIIHIDKLPVCV